MKKALMGVAVVLLAGCSSSFNVMGPLLSGLPACGPSVALSTLVCPGNAVLATQGSINISASNVTIDSYNSSSGAYGGGNVSAAGNIQAGGSINIAGSSVAIGGASRPSSPTALSQIAPTVSRGGNLIISGSFQGMTFTAGDYYFGSINISGDMTRFYTPGGPVHIWFDQINISGSNGVYGSTTAKDLWFFGTCNASVNISGLNTVWNAVIYTPNGNVDLSGSNMAFYGPVVCYNFNLSGPNFGLHRDIAVCGY